MELKMKKYKYYIMSIDGSVFHKNFTNFESDEGDLKKLKLPQNVDYIYKLEQDSPDTQNGLYYFIGYPASITDAEKELANLRSTADYKSYNYIKHLESLVANYYKNIQNNLIVYRTQNGIFDCGSLQKGMLISPTIFAENDSNNEQLDDNKDRFFDKPYIDLE